MVGESIHFATAICLEGQLDGVDQGEFSVTSLLRLTPLVFPINTPEKHLSQIPGNESSKK